MKIKIQNHKKINDLKNKNLDNIKKRLSDLENLDIIKQAKISKKAVKK